MKKKLLILAYYFPPFGGSGSQRPAKFAKYLPGHGWEVSVVTRDTHALRRTRWDPADDSFSDDLESISDLIRVREPCKKNPWFAVDGLERWSIAAAEAALDYMGHSKVDAVLCTMSPFSLSGAVSRIRAAHPDVPVLSDLRDPWALDGWMPHKTYLHWFRQFKAMERCLIESTGVIANTSEAKAAIERAFGKTLASPLFVLENGYDAEDFQTPLPEVSSAGLRLVFAGSLFTDFVGWYSGIRGRIKSALRYAPESMEPRGRTLIYLMRAIEILEGRESSLLLDLQVVCIGAHSKDDVDSLARSPVSKYFELIDHMPHDQMLQHIRSADALFLPLHGLPEGKRSRITPGKTYEYLATGRPILACVPEGDARDLVIESGVGVVAEPTCPRSIADGLERLKELVVLTPLGNKPKHWVQNYERQNQSIRLAEILDSLIDSHRHDTSV